MAIKPEQLADYLSNELKSYSTAVRDEINEASEKAAEELVNITKQTAPKSAKRRRHYVNSIAYKAKEINAVGNKTFVWYVKGSNYRLTHLLIYGHQKKNGGRTRAFPFLQEAIRSVQPKYEEKVKQILRNQKN